MSKNLAYYVKQPNDFTSKVKSKLTKLYNDTQSKTIVRTTIEQILTDYLEIPTELLSDDLRYEYNQLKLLLNKFNMQLVPTNLGLDLNINKNIFIISKVHLENDEDISMVNSIKHKEKFTRSDLSYILRANEKLANFNVFLRVFEGLFVIDKRLDINQRAKLNDLIHETPLPHEAKRLLRILFCYISENDNIRFDFNIQGSYLPYLDQKLNTKIIDYLAQIAANSNSFCNLDENYPFIKELKELYFKYKPSALFAPNKNNSLCKTKDNIEPQIKKILPTFTNIDRFKSYISSLPLQIDILSKFNHFIDENNYELSVFRKNIKNLFSHQINKYLITDPALYNHLVESFFKDHKSVFIPDTNQLHFKFDKAEDYKQHLTMLLESDEDLNCFAYPCIKGFTIKNNINITPDFMSIYWKNYEQNCLSKDYATIYELTLILCMIILPSYSEEYYHNAVRLFEELKEVDHRKTQKILTIYAILYLLDGENIDFNLNYEQQALILQTPNLLSIIHYRLIRKYPNLLNIPQEYRNIFDYSVLQQIPGNYSFTPNDFINLHKYSRIKNFFDEFYTYSKLKYLPEKQVIFKSDNGSHYFSRTVLKEPLLQLFIEILNSETQFAYNYIEQHPINTDYIIENKDTLINISHLVENLKLDGDINLFTSIASKQTNTKDLELIQMLKQACSTNKLLNSKQFFLDLFGISEYITNKQCFQVEAITYSPVFDFLIKNELIFCPLFRHYLKDNTYITAYENINYCSIAFKYVKCFSYQWPNLDIDNNLLEKIETLQLLVELFFMLGVINNNADKLIQKLILNLNLSDSNQKAFAYAYALNFFHILNLKCKDHIYNDLKIKQLATLIIKYYKHADFLKLTYHLIKKLSPYCIKLNKFNPVICNRFEKFYRLLKLNPIDFSEIYFERSMFNSVDNLDHTKIKQKLKESIEVSNVISQIKNDNETTNKDVFSKETIAKTSHENQNNKSQGVTASNSNKKDNENEINTFKYTNTASKDQNSESNTQVDLDPTIVAILKDLKKYCNNNTIDDQTFENLAKKNNFMSKNAAIELINELCFELFDEALLDYDETDGTIYIEDKIFNKLI